MPQHRSGLPFTCVSISPDWYIRPAAVYVDNFGRILAGVLVVFSAILSDSVSGMRTGRCPAEECPLSFMDSSYSSNSSCTILTKQDCQVEWDNLGLELEESGDVEGVGSQPCTSQQLQFQLSPIVSKTRKLAPFTRLNFTFSVFDPETELVGFRFQCISEKRLAYCDPSTGDGGSWASRPCRIYDLRPSRQLGQMVYPVEIYSYCFGPIFDEGYYELKVVLHPQNCSTSFYMLVPRPQQISVKVTVREWRPTVWLSTGEPGGLAVHVAPIPSGLKLEGLDFLLYNGTSLDLRDRHQLRLVIGEISENQVLSHLFKDVPSGNYTVKVGAIHPYCPHNYCLPVALDIVLDTDHLSELNAGQISQSSVITLVAGAVAGLALVAVLIGLFLVWRRRKFTPDPVLVEDRPVVFILYTDDFEAHRRAVLKFAQYFRDFGHCEVIVDEWEFRQSAANLSPETLFAKLSSADFYLVFFSEGSSVYFSDGIELLKRLNKTNVSQMRLNDASCSSTSDSQLNSSFNPLGTNSNHNKFGANLNGCGDSTIDNCLTQCADLQVSNDFCPNSQRLILKPERAMSELFVPAMNLVLRRLIEELSMEPLALPLAPTMNSALTTNSSSGSFLPTPSSTSALHHLNNSNNCPPHSNPFKRLIPVRFSFSPPWVFPAILSQFGAHCHVLPQEVDAVLAQLHGGECANHAPLSSQTREAVDAAAIFVRDRPHWLEDRVVREGDLERNGAVEVAGSQLRVGGDLSGICAEFNMAANERHQDSLYQQDLIANESSRKHLAYHRMIDNDRVPVANNLDQSRSSNQMNQWDSLDDNKGFEVDRFWTNSSTQGSHTGRIIDQKYPLLEMPEIEDYSSGDRNELMRKQKYPLLEVEGDDDDDDLV